MLTSKPANMSSIPSIHRVVEENQLPNVLTSTHSGTLHTHSLSHTPTLSYTLTYCHNHSHSYTHSLTYARMCSYSRTHSHTSRIRTHVSSMMGTFAYNLTPNITADQVNHMLPAARLSRPAAFAFPLSRGRLICPLPGVLCDRTP